MRSGLLRALGVLALASGAASCKSVGGVWRAEWKLELGASKPGAPAAAPAGPGACGPTGGGPYWIEEGQPLELQVTCATGATGVAWKIETLPAGASFDPATGHFRWTPAFDQAAVWRLPIAGPATGEIAHVQIGVADAFDNPSNAPVAAAEGYAAEAGLPVMHLEVPEDLGREAYRSATITYRGHVYRGDAKLRGRSSLEYPKKNFTLKFSKGDPFNEPDLGGGLLGRRRLVLITTFDDNSHIRHRLAFETWNRLDATVKIRHFSVVVFVNGRYNGLYVVADHVDEDLFAVAGLSKKSNLFKVLDHIGDFYNLDFPLESIEKKDGKPEHGQSGSHDDLRAFFDFVVNADADRFRRELPERVHLPDYRAWMFTTLSIHASDSLGKNVYHQRDPRGGPWRAVPWDFNASFGQAWDSRRDPHNFDVMKLAEGNNLWRRMLADPVHGPETRALWRRALEGPLGRDVLLGLLEAYAAEVAAAAKRDERRWRQAYVTFPRWAYRTDMTDFDGEIAYMRTWIADRWAYLLDVVK
jgi:hypothetical protein